MPSVIVSTSDRPDLVEITARWRWEAFIREAEPFEAVLKRAERTAALGLPIPRTLVLLMDGEPVGTASLTAHDLEERPDLTPWLAGVFVVPHARGRGHVSRLVAAVEDEARQASVATLWLYTNTAERIYARIGWRTVETVMHNGKPFALMRRDLWRGIASDHATRRSAPR
ncbi:GNAT family N-acetyltransferase [Rhodopila sp.]|jgi:N-acetylglutamate synthase-like GNAT family acetyltransferase|uniref:GNAT family N-acetyltransferase n=1 Tax=Rhodopila sp. TaxID=2480087 RepID=UPI002BD27C45|nr:GNAT family N-acetyltransferase [Rhodopila sp.]HVZ07071.1 GNAT family N-acetyltransferase [Rhodopila sp.]